MLIRLGQVNHIRLGQVKYANRKADKKCDDERCQQKPAEVIGQQVVPLRAVDAGRVGKETETVVGQKVEPLNGRSIKKFRLGQVTSIQRET